MKRYTFLLLAAAFGAAVSCTRETEFELAGGSAGYELLLRTEMDGLAAGSTRAVGDMVNDVASLQEDAVNTLDVFVSGLFNGDASASVKHFHLNADDHCISVSGDTRTWRITTDWRKDQFVPGNSYTFYVAANSSKVKTSADSGDPTVATTTLAGMEITSLEALGNAIEFDYNPAEGNGAGGNKPFWGSHNDDGVNPAWLELHKKYTSDGIEGDGADRYFTNAKSFLMNGTSGSFTIPTPPAGDIAVAPTLTLSRAASKIVVNVSFDTDFLSKLSQEKNWTVSGDPRWRFFNFAFNTPVFSDLSQSSSYDPTVSRFTSAANMIGYTTIDGNDLVYEGNDRHFGFATYSYPLSWTAATAGEDAPAIILSVGYKDGSDHVTYQAYKIPVVNPDEAIYSLDRNRIYTINATISSEGSTLVSDAYQINAAYSIMPWTSTAVSPITERDNSYIDVVPDAVAEPSGTPKVTDVIIRGNGEQTFRLHVLKPSTKDFDIKYFGTAGASSSAPFAQTGTPTSYPFTGNYTDVHGQTYTACAASGAQVPYYVNLNGNIRNTIAGNPLQNCFVKDGEDLLIISEALPNKGVKYMKIRVYLTSNPTKYMDVNIRHYPTDCLMSTEGQWSSRASAAKENGSFVTPVERGPEDYTYAWHWTLDKSEWERWTYTGSKYPEWANSGQGTYDSMPEERRRSIPYGKEIEPAVYFAHVSGDEPEPGYKMDAREPVDHCFVHFYDDGIQYSTGITGTEPSSWHTPQTSGTGVTGTGDSYYYWGEGTATQVASARNPTDPKRGTTKAYDYYYVSSGYCYYMKYPYHYRTKFHGPQLQVLRYCAYEVTPTAADPKRWANWDADDGAFQNGAIRRATSSDRFNAMKKDGSTWYRLYDDNVTRTYTGDARNHLIYIVRLSETSVNYTLGRPKTEGTFEYSNDQVVSPAFMIASQLGNLSRNPLEAPGKYTNLDAATYALVHCKTYLEYGKDGKGNLRYYTGWRVPTKAEIDIIIKYQGNSLGAVSSLGVSGDDRILAPVLYAGHYYTLDRDVVSTHYDAANDDYTVRCVRDLTPDEIAEFGLE